MQNPMNQKKNGVPNPSVCRKAVNDQGSSTQMVIISVSPKLQAAYTQINCMLLSIATYFISMAVVILNSGLSIFQIQWKFN